jgi:hypothetical protein
VAATLSSNYSVIVVDKIEHRTTKTCFCWMESHPFYPAKEHLTHKARSPAWRSASRSQARRLCTCCASS